MTYHNASANPCLRQYVTLISTGTNMDIDKKIEINIMHMPPISGKYMLIVNSWYSMYKANCTNYTNKLYGKDIYVKLYKNTLLQSFTVKLRWYSMNKANCTNITNKLFTMWKKTCFGEADRRRCHVDELMIVSNF